MPKEDDLGTMTEAEMAQAKLADAKKNKITPQQRLDDMMEALTGLTAVPGIRSQERRALLQDEIKQLKKDNPGIKASTGDKKFVPSQDKLNKKTGKEDRSNMGPAVFEYDPDLERIPTGVSREGVTMLNHSKTKHQKIKKDNREQERVAGTRLRFNDALAAQEQYIADQSNYVIPTTLETQIGSNTTDSPRTFGAAIKPPVLTTAVARDRVAELKLAISNNDSSLLINMTKLLPFKQLTAQLKNLPTEQILALKKSIAEALVNPQYTASRESLEQIATVVTLTSKKEDKAKLDDQITQLNEKIAQEGSEAKRTLLEKSPVRSTTKPSTESTLNLKEGFSPLKTIGKGSSTASPLPPLTNIENPLMQTMVGNRDQVVSPLATFRRDTSPSAETFSPPVFDSRIRHPSLQTIGKRGVTQETVNTDVEKYNSLLETISSSIDRNKTTGRILDPKKLENLIEIEKIEPKIVASVISKILETLESSDKNASVLKEVGEKALRLMGSPVTFMSPPSSPKSVASLSPPIAEKSTSIYTATRIDPPTNLKTKGAASIKPSSRYY